MLVTEVRPSLLVSGVSASDRQVRVVAVIEPSLLAILGVVSGFANGVATVGHVAFAFYIALVLEGWKRMGKNYLGQSFLR
jgi:hypothetical protein